MGMYGTLAPVVADEIASLDSNPDRIDELFESEEAVSVEKMWQVIHFLLTGEEFSGTGPLAAAIMGGEGVGRERGYGPPRLLMPEEVREVAKALQGCPFEGAWARFDPSRMSGIYPNVWDEPEDELKEEIGSYYAELVDVYEKAAKRGDGMLVLIA